MKKQRAGSAGCFLFIIPFAAVGTVMSYLYVADIVNWVRMQSWQEVPAKINSADLDVGESRGTIGTGRNSRSTRSIVYKAHAKYQYEFNGEIYTGTEVSRYFGRDNLGNFYTKIYDEIKSYENSEKQFRCFVNPAAPEKAILYRDMRLGMLCLYGGVGASLGGIGWGFLIGSLFSFVRSRQDTALRSKFPEQPWKWRNDWNQGQIRPKADSNLFVAAGFGILAAIFSVPILFFIPAELLKGNFAALLALIYPILAAFIIKWSLKSVLIWIRSRNAVLHLDTIPVHAGQRMRGVIQTGTLPESAEVKLELRRVKKRSGKILWVHNAGLIRAAIINEIICIPVDIEIPEQSEKAQGEWELRAVAKIPGIDLDATFAIPVFRRVVRTP